MAKRRARRGSEESEVEPIETEARRWLDALEAETGPLALFDTHTHFGRHDPDEFRQEPEQLIATIANAGARAITFPMHEPDGYPPANDEARAIEAGVDGRIVHFCRVNPHDGALAEAERCLDLGAHGIKLHPRAEQFAMSVARGRGPDPAGGGARRADPDPRRPRHPGARPATPWSWRGATRARASSSPTPRSPTSPGSGG